MFVAVYPPREMAAAWLRHIKNLDLPPHRTTPVEQVHMTVQFVGDTPAKQLEQMIESCRRAAKGLTRFALSAERLITLPERGRSRLIAVETDAHPTLLELKRRLAIRLASKPRDNPAKRFRPHMTICRFRTPTRLRDFDNTLPAETFDVDELVLMKSTLSPHGATHEPVARWTLD